MNYAESAIIDARHVAEVWHEHAVNSNNVPMGHALLRVLEALGGPRCQPPRPPLTPSDEDEGEQLRRRYGIDGTMGDAQDVPHPFHSNAAGTCLVCGLAESYRKHGSNNDQGQAECRFTVNVAPGVDPTEMGRQIVDAIKAYERRTEPAQVDEAAAPDPRTQLVVSYADHSTRYYVIGPGSSWRIDAASRCLVIGRGVPRTYVPLDQVRSFDIARCEGGG